VEPVKTALIGLGYWGPNVLRNFAAEPGCKMLWGCDLKEENLEKARAHYPSLKYTSSVDDVMNDPEVELVLIATPTKTHYPLAKRALEAGKHVFVEKPIASTLAEAEELVALAKEKGKMLFVDHTFIFAPAVGKIHDLVTRGSLGDLLYFDSVRINLGLIQHDANVLYDLAIHDLSILSVFKDLADISTVCAIGNKHFGTQEEDAHLHLTFKDGFHAHVHVSWLSPVKIRQTILAGKDAMVTYDDTEPSEKIRIYDRGIVRDLDKPNPLLPTYRVGDVLIPALASKETLGIEAAHVLGAIRGNHEAWNPGEEGVKMLRILERSTESLRQGGIPVPLN
jgi:predicted dehydrogenase